MKKHLTNATKGLIIGASMLLPGVSGGTMAIILGIYEDIISAVSGFFRNPRKNFIYLAVVGIGSLVGIMSLSNVVLKITNTYETPMMFLFLGCIIGSVPLLFQKAQVKKFDFSCIIYPLIGLIIILLIGILPENILSWQDGFTGYLILFAAGIITSIALVLPGISVSFMLLVLGVYQPTLEAIEKFDFAFLIPFILSVIIGVIATTRALEIAMKRYAKQTFLIIVGFVLGSIITVFPGLPRGFEWLVCPFTFAIGFCLIMFMTLKLKNVTVA